MTLRSGRGTARATATREWGAARRRPVQRAGCCGDGGYRGRCVSDEGLRGVFAGLPGARDAGWLLDPPAVARRAKAAVRLGGAETRSAARPQAAARVWLRQR